MFTHHGLIVPSAASSIASLSIGIEVQKKGAISFPELSTSAEVPIDKNHNNIRL